MFDVQQMYYRITKCLILRIFNSATNYQQSTSPQASAARPSASNSLTFAENNLCRSGIRTLDSTHFRDEEPRVSSNASNERSKLLQEIRNGINLKVT